jgi:feruloyl esterase
MNREPRTGHLARIGILSLVMAFACIESGVAAAATSTSTLSCDESMKTALKPDANTTILLVKKVRKGDPYPNRPSVQGVPAKHPTFDADLCWVKLLVGPGTPGPADAPSTSRGIGIEVWLPEPAAWNHRVHALGGGGWANGTPETVLDKVGSGPIVAAEEGAVSSTTDNGQQNQGGSFTLNPDGSDNVAGWRDWTYRGLYEQAVKTKALATAYYGSSPRYSYFSGGSGGGRQALHIAQNLPEQYDGILASSPGPSWSSLMAEVYPSVVVFRDLNGKDLTREQFEAVSKASISACDMIGGQHLGFILDIKSCRYDPTKDAAVLCKSDGGTNETPACLTRRQALVMNKVWYGMTIDGSVPDPAVDNGWDAPLTGVHIWHGYPRGGSILSILDAGKWLGGPSVGRDITAFVMHDPKIGTPQGVKSSIGNGEDGWKNMSYEQLAGAYLVSLAMNVEYGFNANNPDLTRLRNAGTKLMHVTHVHDSSVWLQGHTDYHEAVVSRMGGLASVQSYYRLFVVPGLYHGNFNGTANRDVNPPIQSPWQAYNALTDWVEKGIAPDRMVFSSPPSGAPLPEWASFLPPSHGPEMSLPVCAYPSVVTYVSGDIHKADGYRCK